MKNQHSMKLYTGWIPKALGIIAALLILSICIPAKSVYGEAPNYIDAQLSVTQTGTSLSLRIDYGPAATISSGDTIVISLSYAAGDIIQIVGLGGTTAPIYGTVGGNRVEVGTRAYSSSYGVCTLTVVFNSAYAELKDISGWYTAEARMEYVANTEETSMPMEIQINGSATVETTTVTIPQGGPGTRPGEPDFNAGNRFGKIWRYGDTDGNGGGQFTLDGDYTQFAEMRWFVNIGYSNLTNRDMRANYFAAGESKGYWTTANSLAYSHDNPTDAGYDSGKESYLDYYYWAGNHWEHQPINEPFHYKEVVFNDYLDIGPNYGTILCSPHDYIRDSIKIVRVVGREAGDSAQFKEIADSNFLVEHDGRNINQIFRHFNQTIFDGRRGLTLPEFFAQMQKEGQFGEYTRWEDLITFDTVANRNGVDAAHQVPHFRLDLGDLYFSDSYTGRVTGVKRNNIVSDIIDDVPAKNLPFAYLVYYDTLATGADAALSGSTTYYNYFNRAELTYSGRNTITDFSPMWVRHEDSGGGGTKYTSLKIKKIDVGNNPLQGIEFVLSNGSSVQLTRNTNTSGEVTFAVNVTGSYTLTETVPAGSGLTPIRPITFTITTADLEVGEKDISGLLAEITFAGGVNVITNYYVDPPLEPGKASVVLQALKAATGGALSAGKFSFSLYATDALGVQGALLQTAANDGGGGSKVVFDEILYDEQGEFYYLLAETGGAGEGWSLDTAKYLVKVTVTEGAPAFLAEVGYFKMLGDHWAACGEADVAFTNSYTTPASVPFWDNTDDDMTTTNPPPTEPQPTNPPPSVSRTIEHQTTTTTPEPTPEPTPAPPQTEPAPYVAGGTNHDIPPFPNTPGGALVSDGDGYLEFSEEGVPLGRWEWDEDEAMWIFDEFPPLAGLPPTGEYRIGWYFPAFGALLIALSIRAFTRYKPKHCAHTCEYIL